MKVRYLLNSAWEIEWWGLLFFLNEKIRNAWHGLKGLLTSRVHVFINFISLLFDLQPKIHVSYVIVLTRGPVNLWLALTEIFLRFHGVSQPLLMYCECNFNKMLCILACQCKQNVEKSRYFLLKEAVFFGWVG